MFPAGLMPKPQGTQICNITFIIWQQNVMSHLKSLEKTCDDVMWKRSAKDAFLPQPRVYVQTGVKKMPCEINFV